jgi:hypothetical protein
MRQCSLDQPGVLTGLKVSVYEFHAQLCWNADCVDYLPSLFLVDNSTPLHLFLSNILRSTSIIFAVLSQI